MTATIDELALRREADSIARRRADAIAQHPSTTSRQCPPHAALLHRIGLLIASEELPPVRFVIDGRDILVDCSDSDLVQNTVRRWAAALELIVTEVPCDTPAGHAGTLWSASGWVNGSWWHVAGTEALKAVAP